MYPIIPSSPIITAEKTREILREFIFGSAQSHAFSKTQLIPCLTRPTITSLKFQNRPRLFVAKLHGKLRNFPILRYWSIFQGSPQSRKKAKTGLANPFLRD